MGVSGGYKGVPRADDLVRLLRGDRWVCFDRGLVGITDFGYGVAWLSLVVWLGVELTDTQTELPVQSSSSSPPDNFKLFSGSKIINCN